MKRSVILIIIALLLGGGTFFGVKFILSKQKGSMGGLKVTSTPTTSIFIDNRNIGRTPYEDKLAPGDYTIKLIPEVSAGQIVTWQGRVKISPDLQTVINRELQSSELSSTGEILTLEKTNDRQAQVAVVTTPEGATVQLDGTSRGTAPVLMKNIEPGDHDVSFQAPGFSSRTVRVRTTGGFKLTIDVQLALEGAAPVSSASPSGTPQPTISGTSSKTPADNSKEPAKPYVKILETPTGWLRVREDASTSATESGKVNPGEKYTILSEQSGWFKIEFEKGKQGWVSSKYGEKVE